MFFSITPPGLIGQKYKAMNWVEAGEACFALAALFSETQGQSVGLGAGREKKRHEFPTQLTAPGSPRMKRRK